MENLSDRGFGVELQHFSHSHPLVLTDKNDDKEGICNACRKTLTGYPTYSCNLCDFILHKTCAELPQHIEHPADAEHTLELHEAPPYASKSCRCNICREKWDYFTYHCPFCHIDVCIRCASEERAIQHNSHQHPLILLRKSALFFCSACGTKAEDSSYICVQCEFWIHKSCATLSSSRKHSSHDHPLILAYSLPYSVEKFDYWCDICGDTIHPPYWVYYCPDCRYLAHVKCATSTADEVRSGRSDAEAREPFDPSLHSLPVSEIYFDLIKSFAEQISSTDLQNATEINLPCHEHPLSLSDMQNDMKNGETLCNGCIGPSSEEFYSCSPCGYFLHRGCAALPEKVEHPLHPEHALYLESFLHFYYFFKCNSCGKGCNGFYYACDDCEFYLDLKCASLPNTVKHEAHEHPLTLSIGVEYECRACGIFPCCFALGCTACKFQICYTCALLPRTVTHRWEKHPLPLSIPPIPNHPDEFFCEICEEELHPRHWLYHCSECDQSFHPRCICRLDDYPNVKFGNSLQVSNHEHQLTFLRESKEFRSFCEGCGMRLDGLPVFECSSCYFRLCRHCILKKF